MNAKINLYSVIENGKDFKICYSIDDNKGQANVEQILKYRLLLDFVIESSLNVMEHYDYATEDIEQVYLAPKEYLLDNTDYAITEYLKYNYGIRN